MTGRDLAVAEELSRSFEPCLISISRPCGSLHGYNRGGKACHSRFAVSLLPEVPLLFHRQAARREECSHMLACRRRTLDTEPEWLANGIDHGSCVAHEESFRFDEVGIEVVECDDTPAGGSGDLTQRAFDSLPVQVHRYSFPKEE